MTSCLYICSRLLSLRWNIVTEAISLITDRRTMFAMTIYTTLVMRTTKMAKRHKALAMSYCFRALLKIFLWRGPGSELRRQHGPLQASPSLADAIAT
jgi:hypothetical protein